VSKCLFVCLTLGAGLAVAAPIEWTTGTGANHHWYELVVHTSQITWVDANADALSLSWLGQPGYLASLTTSEENAWVYANIAAGASAWLGGYQAVAGDQSSWHWSNGDPWSFTAWAASQPDNFLGGTQHALFYFSGADWDDGPDSWGGRPSAYVVEFDNATAIPEPSMWLPLIAIAAVALWRARRP